MEENSNQMIQDIHAYERYRLLVEQVKDYAIFMLDTNGYVVSWNQGAQRIKGYAATDIVGQHFSKFYPQVDIDNGKPAMELREVRKHGKFEDEGWRVRKDGTQFWANVIITAVYDGEELIGFSKVTRDLTERKQAEEALQASEERYRLLSSELHDTVKELAAANEELLQFNTVASHDLQEPLRTTYSYLLLIQQKLRQEGSPQLMQYIQKAIQGNIRMKELILSLLNYAQLNSPEKHYAPVSVREVIAESLQNLKVSIEETQARITIEEHVAQIIGNKVRLIQLLQNLVSNALKFRGGKTPHIKISCLEMPDHYQFAVADNGIGIPPEYAVKIFEIFKRLHTQKEYAGTGIGLAICKKIVEYHNGKIWIASTVGEGTIFYFTISKNLPLK